MDSDAGAAALGSELLFLESGLFEALEVGRDAGRVSLPRMYRGIRKTYQGRLGR